MIHTFGVLNKTYTFNSIGRVIFGPKTSEKVGELAVELTEGKRCFVITDKTVYQAGLLEKIEVSLKDQKLDFKVCDAVENEPVLSCYREILKSARKFKPDLIISVGGGSSLDIGKTMAMSVNNPNPLEDYIEHEFDLPGLPAIMIPTTAGTGADITPDAVVRLPEQKIKACFYNVPASAAVIDPTLMLTVPRQLTAATGIDTLSHAIESALSKEATPMTQALALESIRLVSKNLRKATDEGSNLEARINLAWATLMASFSEANAGDCEGHGVAHVLGGFYSLHHGEACSIALPYCMKYNLPVNLETLARIAKAMDENIQGSPEIMAKKGMVAVQELIRDVGTFSCISDIAKAKRDDIPEIAELYSTHPVITDFIEQFTKRGVPTRDEATRFIGEIFDPLVMED